jgi:hypothetical protein
MGVTSRLVAELSLPGASAGEELEPAALSMAVGTRAWVEAISPFETSCAQRPGINK